MRTSLLVVLATVAIQIVATPTMAGGPGGYSPIPNINDPQVQELGRWAVSEHFKKANAGLKFNKVVCGDVQVLTGFKYSLIIEASNSNGKDAKYQAVVWERDLKPLNQLTEQQL